MPLWRIFEPTPASQRLMKSSQMGQLDGSLCWSFKYCSAVAHTSNSDERFPIQSALTTHFLFRPLFYRPKYPQPPEEMVAHVQTAATQALLEEDFTLLSVLGIYPFYRIFWVQLDDLLRSAGMATSRQYSSVEEHLGHDVEAPTVELSSAAYFPIESKKEARCCPGWYWHTTTCLQLQIVIFEAVGSVDPLVRETATERSERGKRVPPRCP